MKSIYVKIKGMHCSHCEKTIRNELLKIDGVINVKFDSNIACISYDGLLNNCDIVDTINSIGYSTKLKYISDSPLNLKSNISLFEFLTIFLSIMLLSFLIYRLFGFNIFNVIPKIDSSITYGMLFFTGVLTSIHCISMCGAINLSTVVNNTNRSIKKPIMYNLGRLVSYTFLGGLAGALGNILSINSVVSGIIIVMASILMFLMSLNMLGIVRLKRFKFFKVNTLSDNSFIIGLLNGLMPCGPLQAMQVYALSTGNFLGGALSMFLFCLGTIPLMFFAGFIFSVVKGKLKLYINKIASVLILILSIAMFNRGLLSLNIDLLRPFDNYNDYILPTIVDGYQVVEFDLSYDNYENIILQKDIPAKIIINVDQSYLTGCNNEIVIDEFGIKQELVVGENIIEFVPKKNGVFTYTCWMNMIKNSIKVVDDLKR